MTGIFGVIEEETVIGGFKLYLRDYGRRLKKYIRENSSGEILSQAVLPGDSVLLAEPSIPVFLPFQFESEAIMVRLKEPVYVTPGYTSTFYVEAPYDIVVYDEDGEIIDIFSPGNPKYGLYGDPNNGVVCRYGKSSVYVSEEDVPENSAVLPVKVMNSYHTTLKITLIVVHYRLLRTYYSDDGRVYYSVAKVELEEKNRAVVYSSKQPPHKGLRQSRIDPYKRKGVFIPTEVGRFELEWGFSIPLTRLTPQS
ncbi:MAG: DUF432 domain-containing protein [Desulfurococcales archaeon]|nr:DUF432 domain-containing protein [Desulfurococcales archaeon]